MFSSPCYQNRLQLRLGSHSFIQQILVEPLSWWTIAIDYHHYENTLKVWYINWVSVEYSYIQLVLVIFIRNTFKRAYLVLITFWKIRPSSLHIKEVLWASQVVLVVKNPATGAGDSRDTGSIPGLGRSPGEGHGSPLQYSCLVNPMDRGTWQATVHGLQRFRHDWSNLALMHIL